MMERNFFILFLSAASLRCISSFSAASGRMEEQGEGRGGTKWKGNKEKGEGEVVWRGATDRVCMCVSVI